MSDYRQNGRCRKFYSEPKTNRILYVTDCREIVGSAKFSKENREKCSEYFRRNLSELLVFVNSFHSIEWVTVYSVRGKEVKKWNIS